MKITQLSKKCLVCDNNFCKKDTESRAYWETKRFCSNKCSRTVTDITKQKNFGLKPDAWTPWNKGVSVRLSPKSEFKKGDTNLNKGKKMPHWKWMSKPKIEKECAYCKMVLSLSQNQVRTRNFCNRQCWALGTRGMGSPVFLGEKATKPLRQRIMAMDEYRGWRAKILNRDNWTCTQCGFRNNGKVRKEMHVDHIEQYRTIVIRNAIKTLEDARNCSELWDLKNGRTLCRDCHRASDTYGTKGIKYKHY